MQAVKLALALLVAAPALAGCIGAGDDATDAALDANSVAPGDVVDGVEGVAQDVAAIVAPVWDVGHYWTWTSPQLGDVTYVVAEDRGSDWFVRTTNPQVAFFDQRTDVSTLGPVRKTDLAGSQGADRIEFFKFPIEAAGASWTTTWDGVQRTITVTDVSPAGASFEATGDDGITVRYAFDVEAGSFASMAFVGPDGTTQFAMELKDWGTGFTGDLPVWDVENVVSVSGTIGAQPALEGEDFEFPEGATDIYVEAAVSCPSGHISFGIAPHNEAGAPDYTGDRTWGVQDQCPVELVQQGPIAAPTEPGGWGLGLIASSPEAEGSYAAEVFVRTLTMEPFGA